MQIGNFATNDREFPRIGRFSELADLPLHLPRFERQHVVVKMQALNALDEFDPGIGSECDRISKRIQSGGFVRFCTIFLAHRPDEIEQE